jgi:PKD repeat protein
VAITDQATVTVQRVSSTVEITSDEEDPSAVNEQITVEFTVSGSGGTPTGVVTVTMSGGPETCSESLTNGSGSCTLTPLTPGAPTLFRRVITASYAGDSRFAPDTDTENHRVNPLPNNAPTADFAAPTNCTAGQPCQFTDGSTDSDGTIATRSWVFQDGSPSPSTAQNPQVTFASAGSKTVTLTVTDNAGASDDVTKQVVVNAPPTAAFAPPTCVADAPCQFTADLSTDSDGTIMDWDWSFSDGGTATGQVVSHTFAGPGPYTATATLTVTDDKGATDSGTENVTVN